MFALHRFNTVTIYYFYNLIKKSDICTHAHANVSIDNNKTPTTSKITEILLHV